MLVLLTTVLTLMVGQTVDDQSLLWKVSRPPSSHTSYLFGTIHLQDSTVFRQRDTALTLLSTCRTFAAEIHLDSAATMMMNPRVILLASGTLYDRLDSTTVRRLMKLADKRMPGMSALVPRMKPGALAALLSIGEHEATAPEAMDVFLWGFAKYQRRTLVGLEYVSEQLQVLDTMGVGGLQRLADDTTDTAADDLQRMIKAYAAEDLATLASMARDSSLMDLDELRNLNDDRNHRMVERMLPLLESGPTFVAIGALHLTGDASVLKLLRERGWTVEPVGGGPRSQWIDHHINRFRKSGNQRR